MRPRKRDRHLPDCVYLKSGSYYYVKRNKWEMIGKDLPEALRNYAKKLAAPTSKMPALLERYMASLTLAPNTIKSYRTAVNHLTKIMADFEPAQVTARDILAVMHHFKSQPGKANVMRAVLVGALDLAFIEMLVERNVARDVRALKTATRDRYITDAELAAIYAEATEPLQMIIDVLYLTGQRIGDVLSIRHSDITEEGIRFKQAKTAHRMVVAWSDDLREVVARAKAYHKSVRGLTLFHTRRGSIYSDDTIRGWWLKACASAGVEDAHVHDIRAKAATDSNSDGLDSKKLLGHASESSHRRYLRSKETTVVGALSFRTSNTKAS